MRAICLVPLAIFTGALSAQSFSQKSSPQTVYALNCPEASTQIYDLYLGAKELNLKYSNPEASSAIIAKAIDDIAAPAPDVARVLWERTLGNLAKLQSLVSQAGTVTSDTDPRKGEHPASAAADCQVTVVYEGLVPVRGQLFQPGNLTKIWFTLDSLNQAALALHLTLGGFYSKPDDEAISRMTATLLSNGADHATKFLQLLKDLPPR